jgi:thiol:disulfide interchange protein
MRISESSPNASAGEGARRQGAWLATRGHRSAVRRALTALWILGLGGLLMTACGTDPVQSDVQISWHTEFATAAAEATATKRPILADFQGSDWCPACKQLHRRVFDTSAFAAWAAQKVVLLDVDLPNDKPQPPAIKAQNQALAERHGVSQFPTILLLDPTGGKIAEVAIDLNQLNPSTFIAAAEAALPK